MPCGPPANCCNSAAISTSSSPASNCRSRKAIIFRHLLRLILLIGEFTQLSPPDLDPQQWREEMQEIADRLTDACRKVDPTSTDKALEQAQSDENEL